MHEIILTIQQAHAKANFEASSTLTEDKAQKVNNILKRGFNSILAQLDKPL